MKIPYFTYQWKTENKSTLPFVYADGDPIHYIQNVDEFYHALGFTADQSKSILPDEFIWDHYISVKAEKSTSCLQIIIIEYLYRESETFRTKYGEAYVSWVGLCNSKKLGKLTDCRNCRMNPYQ